MNQPSSQPLHPLNRRPTTDEIPAQRFEGDLYEREDLARRLTEMLARLENCLNRAALVNGSMALLGSKSDPSITSLISPATKSRAMRITVSHSGRHPHGAPENLSTMSESRTRLVPPAIVRYPRVEYFVL